MLDQRISSREKRKCLSAYFKKRFLECDTLQITAISNKPYQTPEGVRVISAVEFLKTLC
jgi:hypothetical protein